MKYAILTHPLMFNYGGILQNFALQYFLEQNGYDVVTVNRKFNFNYPYTLYHVYNYFKRWLKKCLLKKNINLNWNPNILVSEKEYNIITLEISKFIQSHIHLTEDILDQDLGDLDKKYNFNGYIIGSDQVWLSSIFSIMFLEFINRENLINIVYSASAGNSSWMDNEGCIRKSLLLSKKFQAISAREESLAQKASKILGRKVDCMIDPTLLLSPQDYLSVIAPTNNCKGSIFVYNLDKSDFKSNIISKLSSQLNMPTVQGYALDDYNSYNITLPSIDNWINAIYSSEFIVTDSFHGCAFAILFNKPFAVLLNKERGINRFQSILNLFDLSGRVVYSEQDIPNILKMSMNFSMINNILEKERNKSINFILNNLPK